MRSDKLYLIDIIEATEAINRFLEGVTENDFVEDELRQSAVLQKLMVIGEAAARLSANFKNKHPEIEWHDIIAFRNIAVHAYFAVDWQIAWNTAIQDAPLLSNQIAGILSNWED